MSQLPEGNYVVPSDNLMDLSVGSFIMVRDLSFVAEDFIDENIVLESSDGLKTAACSLCGWFFHSSSSMEKEVFTHAEKHASDFVPSHKEEASVWYVFDEGKAVLVNEKFPLGETEDLDWFSRWEVVFLGMNLNFV